MTGRTVSDGNAVDRILAATSLAPKEAREALEALAPAVAGGVLEDARLLVSELVTNSVRHGSTGPTNRIHLRAVARGGGIHVDVADWGPGFEPVAGARPSLLEPGGFGLYLVGRLATRWGVERSESRTHVWFAIDPAGRPSPGGT